MEDCKNFESFCKICVDGDRSEPFRVGDLEKFTRHVAIDHLEGGASTLQCDHCKKKYFDDEHFERHMAISALCRPQKVTKVKADMSKMMLVGLVKQTIIKIPMAPPPQSPISLTFSTPMSTTIKAEKDVDTEIIILDDDDDDEEPRNAKAKDSGIKTPKTEKQDPKATANPPKTKRPKIEKSPSPPPEVCKRPGRLKRSPQKTTSTSATSSSRGKAKDPGVCTISSREAAKKAAAAISNGMGRETAMSPDADPAPASPVRQASNGTSKRNSPVRQAKGKRNRNTPSSDSEPSPSPSPPPRRSGRQSKACKAAPNAQSTVRSTRSLANGTTNGMKELSLGGDRNCKRRRADHSYREISSSSDESDNEGSHEKDAPTDDVEKPLLDLCQLCIELGNNRGPIASRADKEEHAIAHLKLSETFDNMADHIIRRRPEFKKQFRACFEEGFFDELKRQWEADHPNGLVEEDDGNNEDEESDEATESEYEEDVDEDEEEEEIE